MEETDTECTLDGKPIHHEWDGEVARFISNGTLVGKMEVTMKKNRACFIHYHEIEPRFRGKGIGKCLYNFMEEEYFEEKCDEVSIASMPDKEIFWYNLGFDLDENHPEGMTTPMIKYFGAGAGGLWL